LRNNFDAHGLLPDVELDNTYKVSWIVCHGTRYKRDAILAVSVHISGLPVFGQVRSIFIVHDFVYFEVNIYNTKMYSGNFQAYAVKKGGFNLGY